MNLFFQPFGSGSREPSREGSGWGHSSEDAIDGPWQMTTGVNVCAAVLKRKDESAVLKVEQGVSLNH